MHYIWQQETWPRFSWNTELIYPILLNVRLEHERFIGAMENIGFKGFENPLLDSLTNEVQKTSEIEGENYSTDAVRSSVAKRLGIDIGAILPEDKRVEGIVSLVLDASQNFESPLTKERLFYWHKLLFPENRSTTGKIQTAKWRDDSEGPMRVISGSMGKEKIHYQAPPAANIDEEMQKFLAWFNADTINPKTEQNKLDPVLKSAIAHLWFITIHPFEDGNGRIARAIADLALAQGDRIKNRAYSMSAEIRRERKSYYEILEKTQKGNLDIHEWLLWYLNCLSKAIETAKNALAKAKKHTNFWHDIEQYKLNKRQEKNLLLLLEGFNGKLTSSKYASLGKCSQDTANRDIQYLVDVGVIEKNDAGGRSTYYELNKNLISSI